MEFQNKNEFCAGQTSPILARFQRTSKGDQQPAPSTLLLKRDGPRCGRVRFTLSPGHTVWAQTLGRSGGGQWFCAGLGQSRG